jgi:hypothetical protein
MRYLLTVEAFKSNILSKIFNQVGKDTTFKGAINLIKNRLGIDLYNLKDKYFKYCQTEEALRKRGDYFKLWFSTEDGMLLMTRKNVKINTSNLEQTRRYYDSGYGKNTTSGFDYQHFDLDSIKKYTDFCILIDIEKIKADNITTSELTTKRSQNKPLKIDNEEIKNANLQRYRQILIDKYDFSTQEASVLSVNKLVKSLVRKDNIFSVICGLSALSDSFSYLMSSVIYLKYAEENTDDDNASDDYLSYSKQYIGNVKNILSNNILSSNKYKEITKDSMISLLQSNGYNNSYIQKLDVIYDKIIDPASQLSIKLNDYIKNRNFKSINQAISTISKIQSIKQVENHISNARFSYVRDLINAYNNSNASNFATLLVRLNDYKIDYEQLIKYALDSIDDLKIE